VSPTRPENEHEWLAVSTDREPAGAGVEGPPVTRPGVVVIFASGRPQCRTIALEGDRLELGRVELAAADEEPDRAISRKHVRLAFDGVGWRVRDFGSRNGTSVDGRVIRDAEAPCSKRVLLRIGSVLLLACDDVTVFERYGMGVTEGVVSGPSFSAVLDFVRLAGRSDMVTSLLITGESGTGKEITARVFHDASARPGSPFVAVNCATIPKELAERLLFGARRGAFSGATDAVGHVQAAHGGTLFLDEIGELPFEVQSKLLRTLESHEALRLGATRYEQVDVRVCAATWRDLRTEVADGRFRQDLYFRVAQPEVRLAALRERVEEIPWHVARVLDECRPSADFGMTAGFVEECALRPWPGNVRELRAEVRRAALMAIGSGVGTLRLGPLAGRPIARPSDCAGPSGAIAASHPQDEIATALDEARGNVSSAARRLGVHRNKVRRWLDRHAVAPEQFKAPAKGRGS
jgi:transcriptional regulator with AAA-type ATPase domain